jgi:uncharacterized protein YqeY
MAASEQLSADLVNAMRAKDTRTISTLRLFKSSLHNETIALGHELSDEERVIVLRRELKKRRESADVFAKAGRIEQAENELQESRILEHYLPTQVTRDQIIEQGRHFAATLPDRGPKQRGNLIKALLQHFGSSADGSLIAQVAQELCP